MSYMSRLDAARQHLVAGEFAEAEKAYWEACAEWESSRVRAPLTEKAIEPVLRWGGSLFGRDRNRPALATFPQREAEIREDLEEVARLLARDAVERSRSDDAADPEGAQALSRALHLQSDSQIFQLASADVWPVARAYLDACREHDLDLDAAWLPACAPLPESEIAWLLQWTEACLLARTELRGLVDWLCSHLAAGVESGSLTARVYAAVSRLRLLDPLGAPAALECGRRALASGDPIPEAEGLLRTLAGLSLNEGRLGVGTTRPDLWHELAVYADQLGVLWPPSELAELMRARDMTVPSSVAVLTWDDGELSSLLVLRYRRTAPVDALLLQPSAEGDAVPFGLTVAHAREALDRFVRPDAAILVRQDPPAWVRALLGQRAVVAVDTVVSGLASSQHPPASEPPTAPHPVFDPRDALATPWAPLVREARSMVPRLIVSLESAAFASAWGLDNLRRLGQQPVQTWRGLATCVSSFWPDLASEEPDTSTQVVTGEVRWRWPPLRDRPWPTGRDAEVPERRPEGDVLFAAHPSPEQLAGAGAMIAPSEVWVDGSERASAVARSAATVVDPVSVTWAPSVQRCPERWLQLLERWVQSASSSPARAVDVLWLYRALATSPEGDVERWLGEGGSQAARREVTTAAREADAQCAQHCRLRHETHGCFASQLEERRTYGQIWIEELVVISRVLPRAPVLVVDDVLPVLASLADTEFEEWIDTFTGHVQLARQCLLWANAAEFSRPLIRQLNLDLPAERAWRLWPHESTRALELYLAPAGYAPGSDLIEAESATLIESRRQMWLERDGGSTAVWGLECEPDAPSEEDHKPVKGMSLHPDVDTVVLALASDGGELAPLACLVRLAAAASHARNELVCLDPRVGSAAGLLQGLSPHVRELTPPAKLARSGAEVLSDRYRRRREWKYPLTLDRLQSVADPGHEITAELPALLTEVRRGQRLVLGGLARGDRGTVAALVARLAEQCKDTGPLGLRTVLWVGELPAGAGEGLVRPVSLPADLAALEHTLLAADRGQTVWLAVAPERLDDPVFQRWAGRAGDALWVLPQAERGVADHPLFDAGHADVVARVSRLVAESGSAVLACVDSADESEAAGEVARRLEATVQVVSAPAESTAWRWRRVPLEDPQWSCPTCGNTAPLAHHYDLCPGCGATRVVHAADRAAVRDRVLEATARSLQQRGPHDRWIVVASDREEKHRLEAALGLAGRATDPLLGAEAGDAYLQRVVAPVELWSLPRGAGEVVLTHIPKDEETLSAILSRMTALGWDAGTIQVLDHPLQWSEDTHSPLGVDLQPLEGARVQWVAARAEVEFRFRETMESLVPRLRSRTPPAMIGLGPVRDPGEDPKLSWILQALQQWDLPVPTADDATGLTWSIQDALAGAARCVDDLVHQGLGFDASGFRTVDWEAWPTEDQRLAARSFARWSLREGLLEMAELTPPARDEATTRHWRQLARSTLASQATDLPQTGRVVPQPKPLEPSVEVASNGWVLGVAGSGKTRRAADIVRGLAQRTEGRILILVPHAVALLPWQKVAQDRDVGRRVDVATVSELGLAFLRHHQAPGGFGGRPRLMPDTPGEERERLREQLLEAVSRKYAQATGMVPPVDWVFLERLLGGTPLYAQAAVAGAADLDTALLAECARSVRHESGWINDADLRQLSRRWLAEHPYVAGAWRDRYRAVVLEDVEVLHPDQLTFVEQMFPEVGRWTTGDPFLVSVPLEARERAEYRSWRASKEAAKAAGELLFVTHGEPATRIRSRDRHKGKITRHHVLNLESCAAFLEGQLAGGRFDDSRVGVVVGHDGDLHRLGSRLREAQVRVWPTRDLGRACAPGPRQLLALLLLARALADGDDEGLAPLVKVVLEAGPYPREAEEAVALTRQLVADRLGSASALVSPEACYLQPLLSVARRLVETETLSQAFAMLQRTHFLQWILDGDASGGRLLDYVEAHSQQSWREILLRVDPAAIADPLATGPQIWVARVDQLAGLEFDHVVYLCTGHEPPEQHYRVLGRARDSFTVLYSERDPLASPR